MSGSNVNGANIFIPLCLYSVFFKKRSNLQKVLATYGGGATGVLMVVCDDLHAVNVQIRGDVSAREAQRRAREQGTELLNMAKRVVGASPNSARTWLCRWGEIAALEGYVELEGRVRETADADAGLSAIIECFVEYNVERFGWSRTANTRGLERAYLCSEITMTVYMCEFLGFGTHMWESSPSVSRPDPIAYLYDQRIHLVSDLIGREPAGRRLIILR